jgi:MerR family transcriptional regulator, copper efflux regulator
MNGYPISVVARRTGFTPATLRYYERIDLVRPVRGDSGYRRYSDDDVELLTFIARAKRLGLSLDQIQALVDGWRRDDCRSTRDQLAEFVEERLVDVRHLIGDLVLFRDQLEDVHRGLCDRPASTRCGPGCGCDVEVAPIDIATSRSLALVAVNRRAGQMPPTGPGA